jgi:hypothetical protein
MQLVLGGAVEVLDEHSARVTSQRDGTTQYYVVNGTCQCHDMPHAPQLMCKHRIARGIAVRAREIARDLADADTEQPFSQKPAIPSEFIVQIQGKPYVTYHGLLHLAQRQGLLSLTAAFTTVTDTVALAFARAEFHDGRVFTEAADSTPDNVGKQVQPHWRRMALVRAKARCLRDALDIAMVAVEELQ